ncbi:hypothetical protein BFP77_04035 [Maribacter sp. 4U21]|uniref:hypothetical protein n=1 Tax=Maribacter sp. 4U21 TaxID=1889779 RepID=UPI000C14CB73|nr:hypothetical protein [Maribacter sp. 4U21]PIB30639.1 hypothetical protein BFP77_04035 [Maribacter sp. 4U21]
MKFQEAFRCFLVSLSSTAGNGEGKLVKSANTAGTGKISGVSTSFVGRYRPQPNAQAFYMQEENFLVSMKSTTRCALNHLYISR